MDSRAYTKGTTLNCVKGPGGGGGLHQNYLEIDFIVVSDRGE